MERKEDWKSMTELRQGAREKRLAERREKAATAKDTLMVRQQAEICQRVSCGQSMLTVLTEGDRNLPSYRTALEWLTDYPDFAEAYSKAQRARADVLFEETMLIADDARNDWMARNDPNNPGWAANMEHIQRSKLRVDTRRWAVSKLNASRYGDKLAIEGDPTKPVVVAVTHRIVQVVRQETLPADQTIEHDPVAAADMAAGSGIEEGEA